MIISYYSKASIKLQMGDMVIALNPVSKDSKGKVAKYGADICFVSTNHPDYNGVDQVTTVQKMPYVINGPGEYEIGGIFIKSFGTKVELPIGKEKKTYQNASYIFTFDGMRVVYLGALHEKLMAEHKELIDETDVLFVPIGGDDTTLNPYDAAKLAVSLEPKVVIPIDYNEETLPIFLKEMSQEGVTPVEKLTIKKKDIDGKTAQVVLLHES